MIRVGIIGSTGYTGAELVRILSRHPQVQLAALTSQSYVGQDFDQVYPSLRGYVEQACVEQDLSKVVEQSDVVFVALPHGHAVAVAEEVLKQGKKVIDLGADLRFDSGEVYEEWYKVEHTNHGLLANSVYGLPELNRELIQKAQLVGNPGCFPTASLLGMGPLLKAGLVDPQSIIVDAKSGVSGAGRGLNTGSLYAEVNESVKAYNVGKHRHTPEIEQEAGKLAGQPLTLSFTPHLMPMTRGILSTIYMTLKEPLAEEAVHRIYLDHYAGEPFVRLLEAGQWPQTKWCYGSNNCFIGLTVDPRTNRVVVTSAIDNLVKGASGQAIQNLNLLFGLPETTGLDYPGVCP